jgi:hypothetical protein
VYLCVWLLRGFKVFPVSVSFKCSVSKNASQYASQKSLILVWLKVAIPKISCDNLSAEEMYSIHWICPVCVRRSSDLYPCDSLACSNDFNYSDGFMHRLWWISADFVIGLKVVVYLPSKELLEMMSLMYFFKLDDSYETWKCPHIRATPGFQQLH